MIEVMTVGGYRKLIHTKHVVTINELSEKGKSNTVIVLDTGEAVFVANTFDEISSLITKEENS